MKSVKNFRYVEKTSAECNENSYLAILHLSRVELHCKLQEKLHRVTWPLGTLFSEELLQERERLFRSASESCTFRMGLVFFSRRHGKLSGIVKM